MDMYGLSAPDMFRIDDLLDFSNDEIFSSAATATTTDSDNHHYHQQHLPSSGNTTAGSHFNSSNIPTCHSTDFTDDLCVPVSTTLSPLLILSRKLFLIFLMYLCCVYIENLSQTDQCIWRYI